MQSLSHKQQQRKKKAKPQSILQIWNCNLLSKIEQKGSKRERKKEKGLEIISEQQLSCISARDMVEKRVIHGFYFPFAFSSGRGLSWNDANSNPSETEGRACFIPVGRPWQGNVALQSCRATASQPLKKGTQQLQQQTACKNASPALLLQGIKWQQSFGQQLLCLQKPWKMAKQ